MEVLRLKAGRVICHFRSPLLNLLAWVQIMPLSAEVLLPTSRDDRIGGDALKTLSYALFLSLVQDS